MKLLIFIMLLSGVTCFAEDVRIVGFDGLTRAINKGGDFQKVIVEVESKKDITNKELRLIHLDGIKPARNSVFLKKEDIYIALFTNLTTGTWKVEKLQNDTLKIIRIHIE